MKDKNISRSQSMYTSPFSRASTTYKTVGVETSVQSADPHRLIQLLFEEVLRSINVARGALARQQIAQKGMAIGKAVRVLEEGLKASLDIERGGEVASNLQILYEYCVAQLMKANLSNDDALLLEVRGLIEPVAQAWAQIAPGAMTPQVGRA